MSHPCLVPLCEIPTPDTEDVCRTCRSKVSWLTLQAMRHATTDHEYDQARTSLLAESGQSSRPDVSPPASWT